jgi:hypothetical protein
VDQVIKVIEMDEDDFQKKVFMLAVLFDFRAEYDKAWRQILHKLTKTNISGQLGHSFPVEKICACFVLQYSLSVPTILAGLASRHCPELRAF